MKDDFMLVVRKANKTLYREFKKSAVERDLTLGAALNEAMLYWIENCGAEKKPDPKNLLKIKPFDFGKGTEKLSTRIDEILYE